MPYSIVEAEGVNIGFFGLIYPDTPVVTRPQHVEGLYFGSPVQAARQSVAALQEAGADVIIALAHLGIDGSAWGRIVANEVPEIDLIIDGHSHTALAEGYQVGDVLIVQAGAHARYLGRVDIVLVDGEVSSLSASLISRDYALENFEPRPDVTAAIEQMNATLGEVLNVVVGYSAVTFYGDSPEHRAALRSSEVPIGNLVADAVLWATEADLALVNSGGIRAHIHAGEITKGDIIEVLAFFNYAVVVEITPAQLREALENGVSNMPGNGRFPQVAGFSFVFDQNAEEGSRILRITVDGKDLDLNDNKSTFTIAINDFMVDGGDGYTIFKNLPRVSEAGSYDELLIAYMEIADLTTVGVEGRIINIAVDPMPEGLNIITEPADEYVVEPHVPEPTYIPESAPTPAPVTGTATVVDCWFLNVRSSVGVRESNIIGVLRAGDVVNVIEYGSFRWHRIEADNITGWVYAGFLQIN